MKTFCHVNASYTLPTIKQVNAATGRYYLDTGGRKYTSVTTFLGADPAKNASLERWRERVGRENAANITNAAARKGTHLHGVAEKYLSNEFTSEDMLMTATKNLQWQFRQVLPTLDRIDNIRHQETRLFSRMLGLAGTVDCVAQFDGIESIIDFKTSLRRKAESWITNYFLQETCYSLMMEEQAGLVVPQIVTIIVSDDGYCDVFVKQRKSYFQELRKRLTAFRVMQHEKEKAQEHEGQTPGVESDSSDQR